MKRDVNKSRRIFRFAPCLTDDTGTSISLDNYPSRSMIHFNWLTFWSFLLLIGRQGFTLVSHSDIPCAVRCIACCPRPSHYLFIYLLPRSIPYCCNLTWHRKSCAYAKVARATLSTFGTASCVDFQYPLYCVLCRCWNSKWLHSNRYGATAEPKRILLSVIFPFVYCLRG